MTQIMIYIMNPAENEIVEPIVHTSWNIVSYIVVSYLYPRPVG